MLRHNVVKQLKEKGKLRNTTKISVVPWPLRQWRLSGHQQWMVMQTNDLSGRSSLPKQERAAQE